ncbi:MAG TPA: hypothetical protein VIO14_07275 [Dehalococcoidia bacterium]
MPSAFLTLGLYVGGGAFLLVMALSWNAGTAPEWAVVRGLLAFGAFAFLGWLAAYIAGTVPPAPVEGAEPAAPGQEEEPPAPAEAQLPPAEATDGGADGSESAAA